MSAGGLGVSQSNPSCLGGQGGRGGSGGAGGGGAGGSSIGVVTAGGGTVQVDSTTPITTGTVGAGGADGTGATTGAGAGAAGRALPQLMMM
jgi:hypothetical protein